MKIVGIDVWQVDLPLREPYSLSGGRLHVETLDSSFVRVRTDKGLAGWGEACPWGSSYLPAHGAGVRAALTILAPALLGADPRGLEAINRHLDLTLPGHHHAKSALDIACWDLLGQACDQPLWRLLGARRRRRWR